MTGREACPTTKQLAVLVERHAEDESRAGRDASRAVLHRL